MIATLTARRVVCPRAVLAAALKDAARVLPGKALQPILTCVHLVADSEAGTLTIGATDLSIALVRTLHVDSAESFAVAVPGAELATLIGNLGSATVELIYDDERKTLLVLSDGVRATFKTQPASDYPRLPTVADATWELPTLTLQQALTQTIYAAAQDLETSRPALDGIALHVEGDVLYARGADGRRASISRHGLLLPVAEPLDALPPMPSCKQLLSLLGKAPEMVAIWLQGGQLICSFGDTLFGTRLIEGQYPDLERVIPTECKTTVVCSTTALLAAVRQVEVLAERHRTDDKKGPAVTQCRLSIGADEVRVSAGGSLGDGTSTLAAVVQGEALEIGMDSVYLREALEVLGSVPVELGFNAPSQPIRIRRQSERDFTQVIMPIYLAGAK